MRANMQGVGRDPQAARSRLACFALQIHTLYEVCLRWLECRKRLLETAALVRLVLLSLG